MQSTPSPIAATTGHERNVRLTASTITDPDLEELYAERDQYLRLLAILLILGASA